MRASACFAFSLLVLVALRSVPGSAYTPSATSGGILLHWADGTVIRYTFNENFAPNNDDALVRGAVGDALRTLEASVPGSSGVRFEDAGTTSLNKSGFDCINLITFTASDPEDQLPPGVLAQARTTAITGAGTFDVCGEQLTVSAGQIVDADMLYNTTKALSTSLVQEDVFDIQGLALHEGGHWLGLNHTGIVAAVMSPFGEGGEAPVRLLHSDDTAGLTAIYGSSGGAISGRITLAGGGNVKAAHVVATNSTTGVTTASATSDQDGYRISGLPAGSYKVFVEPYDDPVTLSDLPGFFQDGNAQFETTFLTNPVAVGTSVVSGVDIEVATPTAPANLTRIGLLMGNSFFLGGAPVSVRRGADSSIVLDGDDLSGQASFSSPGITTNDMGTFTDSTGATRQFVDTSVAANAALGPTDIYFGSASYTSGVVVTVNPQVPSNGIVDAAASNVGTSAPHYAPGSIISVFGVDMAEQIAEPDSIPLPTQLAGVSVLVGNRLAPLYFVSPGQINAMIPFETTGSSVNVSVIAGPDSQSALVTLSPLGSSAPRVFLADPQSRQGAVLIANTPFVAAPEGKFPGSRPAMRGEFVSIFCTGLGAVTNQPASGVPASGNPLSTSTDTPTVTIGGVQANVVFSGLAPTFVGLYQINAEVPASAATGDAVPLLVSTCTSNEALIAVQ